jgi:4'-phosphopantetheinyl transferase EntD
MSTSDEPIDRGLEQAIADVTGRARLHWGLTAVSAPGRAAARQAGDAAARLALARGGAPGGPEGHAADGRVHWPAGYTGSISHTDRLAVAVVTTTDRHRGVGVDIEVDGALAAMDAALVLSPAELARAGGDDRWITAIWSAKESAFKAWSNATDGRLRPVDPRDIHITVGGEAPLPAAGTTVELGVSASGTLADDIAAVGELCGRAAFAGGHVLTVVASR